MTYLTPIELSLETELEKLGLPFGDRRMAHEMAMADALEAQSFSGEEIEKFDERLREGMKRRLGQPKISWERPLLFRTSLPTQRKLHVIYIVHPSEKNKQELAIVRNGEAYEPLIGQMLEGRTFLLEEVHIDRYPLVHTAQETLAVVEGGVREDDYRAEEMAVLRRGMRSLLKTRDPFLYIGFFGDRIERSVAGNAPENFLDDIMSPVDDAYRLASRVCEFLRRY